MTRALRTLAVYLGLYEDDEAEFLARQCRRGRHVWSVWMHDTTPVPLMKYTYGGTFAQAGWEFFPLAGPTYRCCMHCPAMERAEKSSARDA